MFNRSLFRISPGAFYANVREAQRASSIEIRHGNRIISLHPESYQEYAYLITLETKEEDTTEWIRSFPPNSVFYDIGANIGTYSLLCLLYHQQAQVISIEPNCDNFVRLIANLNACGSSNATAYQFAVGVTSGLAYIDLESPGRKGGRSQLVATRNNYGVSVVSLDQFVGSNDQPFPNYIKIDVDGLEVAILRGSTRVLSDSRLKSVLVELRDETRHECIELMSNHGFSVSSVHPRTDNHIFVRRESSDNSE